MSIEVATESTAKTATIVHNPVIAVLKTGNSEVKRFVAKILSYEVNTVGRSANGHITSNSTTSSFYNFRTDAFPAGFVRLVRAKLERAGIKVLVKNVKAPAPCGPEFPIVDGFGFDPRYDYQIQAMQRLVDMRNMVAMLATGGGKSRVFKLCAERLGLPTLFVTTRKTLMYQMSESYTQTIKKPIGIIGDTQWAPVKDGVNFATVQTLAARIATTTLEDELDSLIESEQRSVANAVKFALVDAGLPTQADLLRALGPRAEAKAAEIRKRELARFNIDDRRIMYTAKERVREQLLRRQETLSLLENVGFLCLEEAHEVGGDGFYKVAQSCVNAHYRLALTATPFMREDQESNMRLMATTGQIGIRVTEKDLIERGILAKPFFKYIEVPPNIRTGVKHATSWSIAYDRGVIYNAWRNAQIVRETVRAKKHGLTTMILIQREVHGKNLLKLLEEQRIKAAFINGKDPQDVRKAALKALSSGRIECLIGSTILDVGVDVPSVGLIILGGAGKAEVANRQRIGRGLRAKKNGPNVCFVVDFADSVNKYLIKHSVERKRIILDTPGFCENIVSDFDYSIFTKPKE